MKVLGSMEAEILTTTRIRSYYPHSSDQISNYVLVIRELLSPSVFDIPYRNQDAQYNIEPTMVVNSIFPLNLMTAMDPSKGSRLL